MLFLLSFLNLVWCTSKNLISYFKTQNSRDYFYRLLFFWKKVLKAAKYVLQKYKKIFSMRKCSL